MLEQSLDSDRNFAQPWRGAEAFHLYLLVQRQFYDKDFRSAYITVGLKLL